MSNIQIASLQSDLSKLALNADCGFKTQEHTDRIVFEMLNDECYVSVTHVYSDNFATISYASDTSENSMVYSLT